MHELDSTLTWQNMRAVLLFITLVMALGAAEVLPEDRGIVGLRQALKQLSTEARVLYVTAHPDDEDPTLLTYLSRGLGAKVTLVILNRGEGGANVVSGDFFEALGVLRTAEMLKAAQYYGVDVRFTRTVDYGFSKNIGEALRTWKEDEVLADVVAIARQVKPHVIISRFNESERDGHGHHQTAGRMARKVFATAATADWKPLKLYTTNWREGEAVTLKINTGAYDAVLGRSYAQIGREGYRWHRSQGMANNIQRPGEVWSYLKLEGSNVGEAAGETSVLERVPHEVKDPAIVAAVRECEANDGKRCAAALAEAWHAVPARRERIENALRVALGLELEALVEPEQPVTGPFAMFRPIETLQVAQPGQTFKARVTLHQRGGEAVTNVRYEVQGPVKADAGVTQVTVASDAAYTSAFWRRKSVRDAMYELADERLLGVAMPDSGVRAVASFEYRGVRMKMESEFETSSVDPRVGAQRQPLVIGPPVSVELSSAYGMAPIGKQDYEVSVVVRNLATTRQRGRLKLALPAGFALVGEAPVFDLAKEKEETRVTLKLRLPAQMASQDYQLRVAAEIEGREYGASFKAIGQPGLRTLYWSEPAVHALRAVDVRVVSGLRVGYIMGSGDEVPEGLRQLGVPVEMLSESALATGNLNQYSTIVVGIRAYAARDDIKRHNARLLDYVAQGGVLIVQYQTQEYDKNFGPYPYAQGRGAEEVSEEDAPLVVLEPGRVVFQTPNRITEADFKGWVEQRGSKFFATWAPEWTPLVETHDQGQAPQKGVWLEARHGKGLYVYCSLAWYRQLPYAVPGPARIVANLVSLGAPDAAWRHSAK
jgi:LmbE family N-acetylglucosaminyl deacetylase